MRASVNHDSGLQGRVRRWQRIVALQLGVLMALTAVIVMLLLRDSAGSALEQALGDDELRQAAIDKLVETGAGIYDSTVDADVGRVLQPNLEQREFMGVPISTNAYGMRERDYDWPRSTDGVRVVLLGDSYVFGYGIEADHRIGAFLEPMLTGRSAGKTPAEVLHLAVSGWSLRAQCAYLRRQLSKIRPDLVVQIVVQNDLNDSYGTRGFGSTSRFDPRRPERGNGTTRMVSTAASSGQRMVNPLPLALDYMGRQRYATAAAELKRLATAVEAVGGALPGAVSVDALPADGAVPPGDGAARRAVGLHQRRLCHRPDVRARSRRQALEPQG